MGWRGAKGPERPFWGRRGSADPGVLAPEHPLGSVGSAARVRFSTQISVHSPFCPSSPSARAGISFCHFLQKNFFLVSRRQRVLHPCSPALSKATRTRTPVVDAHPRAPGLHNQFCNLCNIYHLIYIILKIIFIVLSPPEPRSFSFVLFASSPTPITEAGTYLALNRCRMNE